MKPLALILAMALPAAALAEPDGGLTIWAQCPEPPPGDVAQDLGDAGVLLTPARAAYDACRLGAAQSCGEQLAIVPQFPDAGFTWQQSHTVATVTGVLASLLTLYITDRQARHLPLLP